MNHDPFVWLQAWYKSQCDGEWEHSFGIHIETLDNPGWMIHVDLQDTALETRELQPLKIDRTDSDWLHYRKDAKQFFGACSPQNFSELLECFKNWANEECYK